MFLVDRETPGFSVEADARQAGAPSVGHGPLRFDQCRLPADALLGQENQGFYQIMQCFEHERLVIAAGCVGAAESCLDDTRRYVQERVYGAGHLSDMQVTKQRLAKSYMELEAARQLVYYQRLARRSAAYRASRKWPWPRPSPPRPPFRIIDDCLQLHGGWGYFSKHQVQRAYRDIRLDRIGGGATEVMYDIIAKQIGI